jgi:hypothetical protein
MPTEPNIASGQADVFISYSSKDVRKAEALEAVLIKAKKTVWRDKRRLKPGEHIDIVIPEAPRSAGAVVTLWSTDSASSDRVMHETSYAVVEGKCVTLSIGAFDYGKLSSVYRPLHCGDLDATLADPRLLLQRLAELADPAHRRKASRVDVSKICWWILPLQTTKEAWVNADALRQCRFRQRPQGPNDPFSS